MPKRIGGFIVPDGMELPKDELEEETTDESTSEDSTQEETHTEKNDELTEEVIEEVTEEVTEEATEDTVDSKKEPIAILNVYGKQVPVQTMEELISYAQRGVDYAQKLHLLKQWRTTIEAVSYNPQLKTLVDKVINGEDISSFVKGSKETPSDSDTTANTSDTDSEDDENLDSGESSATGLREALEEITDKKIQKAMLPYMAQLREKELQDYLKTLEAKNPQHHKTITQLILMALQDDTVPAPIKEAIKTDRNFFENMYYQIKEKLEQNEKATTKVPEAVTEEVPAETTKQIVLEKKRSVSKVPTLEGGKDSQTISTVDKVLADADKIWNMSPDEFKNFEVRAKRTK